MKVGDYVRTKDGALGKIIDKYKVNDYYKIKVDIRNGWIEKHKENLFKRHIVKSSPNIIDLIEVGDICTFEVVDIDNYEDYIGKHTELIKQDELDDFKNMIENESAKLISIVTKEQFEEMEYKI